MRDQAAYLTLGGGAGGRSSISAPCRCVSVPAPGWAHSAIDFRLASRAAMFDFRRLGIPDCFCSQPSIMEWLEVLHFCAIHKSSWRAIQYRQDKWRWTRVRLDRHRRDKNPFDISIWRCCARRRDVFWDFAQSSGWRCPWCAVINIGTGTVYWDCQYPTFEACYHLGNILAGNRGFVI